MKENKKVLGHLVRDERGATAAEYAILASLIAAAIVMVVSQVGFKVLNLFSRVIPGW